MPRSAFRAPKITIVYLKRYCSRIFEPSRHDEYIKYDNSEERDKERNKRVEVISDNDALFPIMDINIPKGIVQKARGRAAEAE